VSAQEATTTVLDRLIAADLDSERARRHLQAEYVRVDGRVVTDPAARAPRPATVVLRLRP
jgi:hypothetical protein